MRALLIIAMLATTGCVITVKDSDSDAVATDPVATDLPTDGATDTDSDSDTDPTDTDPTDTDPTDTDTDIECALTVDVNDAYYARFEGIGFDNSCTEDRDCDVGGCSGEVCAAEMVGTTCEVLPYTPTGTCGCVSGTCAWAIGSCSP